MKDSVDSEIVGFNSENQDRESSADDDDLEPRLNDKL